MSEMKAAIIEAAQRRMQAGGFSGFSFREIAADVGVKSSSVHHHFPTKEDLAAAVLQRWADRVFSTVDEAFQKDPNPQRVWTKLFRGTAMSEPHMCPCTVLAASSHDLPVTLAVAVQHFFQDCRQRMLTQGLASDEASKLLSTLIGALVVSNAMRDTTEYDRATKSATRMQTAQAA